MANPKDFSARQIRSSQLIASGGIAGTGAGLIVYSASVATDLVGGLPTNLLSDVGDDVYFFVSGSKNSKVARGDSGNGYTGVTLFGGDVVFSGTMYADRMVVELDLSTTGSVLISGSLFVSRSITAHQGLTANQAYGSTSDDDVNFYGPQKGNTGFHWNTDGADNGELFLGNNAVAVGLKAHGATSDTYMQWNGSNDSFIVSSPTVPGMIVSDGSTNQLILHSSGSEAQNTAGAMVGSDVATYISGAVGSAGAANSKGATLFTGDIVVSGSADLLGGGTATFDDLYVNNHAGVSGSLAVDGSAIFNESALSVDFRVESEKIPGMIIVDADTNQLILHSSGTDATTAKSVVGTDVATYISGSVGSKNIANTKGTTLVTGDLVISGGMALLGAGGGTLELTASMMDLGWKPSDPSARVSPIFRLSSHNDQQKVNDPPADVGTIEFWGGDSSYKNVGAKIVATPGGAWVTSDRSPTNIEFWANDDTTGPIKRRMEILGGASAGAQVLILSGTTDSATETVDPREFTDTNFFVSGSRGTRNSTLRGTSVFGGDLVVSGNTELKSSVTINESAADFDFRAESQNIPGAIVIDSGTDQLLLHASGTIAATAGGAGIPAGTDVATYISGTVGSFGVSNSKGVTLITGDTVISGSLHGGYVSMYDTEILTIGSVLQVQGSNFYFDGGATDTDTSPDGDDIVFSVSGSIGNKDESARAGNGGTAVFGGDLVVSGNTYLAMKQTGPSGLASSDLANVGVDVNFFVSGSDGGKVRGEGVAVFGGDLQVSGGIYIGSPADGAPSYASLIETDGTGKLTIDGENYIQLSADSEVMLFAGYKEVLTAYGTGVVVNELAQAAVDFRVETATKTHALFVDADTDQILILSGGAQSDIVGDAQSYTDTNFFVSGSIGSVVNGFGAEQVGNGDLGAAVFGGDVVISGALFTPASTIYVGGSKLAGTATGELLFLSGGAATDPDPSTYKDINFFVSGSSNSKNSTNKGTALFGGDVVVSGSFFPGEDNASNLGSENNRWANVYTGDLHLRNEKGSWTIQEDVDRLIVINNMTGKRYKMALEPLGDEE